MKNTIMILTLMSIIVNADITNAQWIQTDFPYSGAVNCIAVANNGTDVENIFAGTEGGGVFLSTNDGASWQVVNGLENTFVSCIAVSDSNIYVGILGLIYHSTNSGTSWTPDTGFAETVQCIAINDSDIFTGTKELNGGPGKIYRSTNNGASWNQIFVASRSYTFVSSLIISDTNVFAGTDGTLPDVLRSSNNGLTWKVDDTTFYGGGGINAFAVIGSNLFAGTNTGVYLSTNSGLSWGPVNNGLPDYVNNYGWITTLAVGSNGTGGNDLFAGTDSAGVFLSIDNGASWKAIGMTNYYINALTINDTYVFAATGEGVWRRPLTEILTGVEGQGIKIPNQFILEQNYPNPFNPSTTIKFQVPNASFVNLKVYDVLGNEVTTLVNEEKPVGTYELNWNAANLPSGVYFYRLQAGSFVETKKMILLK